MLYLDYPNNKYVLGISRCYVPKSSHLHFLKLSSTNRLLYYMEKHVYLTVYSEYLQEYKS